MAGTYTDQQPTRVVRRASDTMPHNGPEAPRIGNTQPIPEQERLLDGISIPQIIAGAAAAATSMALASQIGIAGSVIGAAVSSVVTVVSSQLYRRFLSKSAEKLKSSREILGGAGRAANLSTHDTMNQGYGGTASSHAPHGHAWEETEGIPAGDPYAHAAYGAPNANDPSGTGGTTVIDAAGVSPHATSGHTHAMAPSEAPATRTSGGASAGRPRGARVAPTKLQALAAAERAATQRKVVVFSAAAAAIAVIACAAAILIATAGDGLGTKAQSLLSAPQSAPVTSTTDDAASAPTTEDDGSETQPTTEPDTESSATTSDDAATTPATGTNDDADNAGDATTGSSGSSSSDSVSESGNGNGGSSGSASDATGSDAGATDDASSTSDATGDASSSTGAATSGNGAAQSGSDTTAGDASARAAS